MILTIPYPDIGETLFEIGPIAIRWYSLAYIAGLVIGWRYCRRLALRPPQRLTPDDFDDFLLWATLGVVVGGRLGSVLFYNPAYYLANPLEILYLWRGGMSFHGGLLGVLVAVALFAHRRNVPIVAFADYVSAAAPIGLFFGRLANFVNSELWGRATDLPWAMVFPKDPEQLPRHPSQLYEAGLEGLLLFLLLYLLIRRGALARPGLLSGTFLTGYGLSRFFVELLRQPDHHLGFLVGGTTMGQWLSGPMLLGGLALLVWSLRGAGRTGKETPPAP
ncbi:MAG: prolipoprotein diacylglyceryl transferase [Rhodospirillales bacterium]|nr:prolipoprotein diacylglyceryl transferase [Rhodospirillales bacterium]